MDCRSLLGSLLDLEGLGRAFPSSCIGTWLSRKLERVLAVIVSWNVDVELTVMIGLELIECSQAPRRYHSIATTAHSLRDVMHLGVSLPDTIVKRRLRLCD